MTVDEAADRLDAFLARLDRLGLEDLRLLALPVPDPEERAALLAEVGEAAASAGRTALVEEGRTRARAAIVSAYDRHQYDPTWVGLNWGRSLGTTKDRLGLILATEDAAIAAVMSDILDDDLVESLAEPVKRAAGMTGATTTPSLSLERPGREGWLLRIVFVITAIVAIGATAVVGAAQIAIGVIAAILAGRRRAPDRNSER